MERIGDLVGIDADQAGGYPVDATEEVFELDPLELREEPLQLGVAAAPERKRATDEVLPRAALRLAEPERRIPVERRAAERRIDALVCESMPCLVHRRPERAQVVRLVPRRHPDVRPRERGRERVHCRVEPVRALLETEVAQDPRQELLLRRDRKVALEERVVRRLARIAHDGGQLRPEQSKTAFTSAVVIPGSYSSRNAS